ncbi:MAG: GspH/FimT family pseudopilin [Verrucomicrobiota bacterium]
MLNRSASKRCRVKAWQREGAAFASRRQRSKVSTPRRAFTLIELILVLALLVVITSIAAPPMAKFIRGRALDTEARRMISFMHAAQSRAVSEGAAMMLWINGPAGTYGLAAESSAQNGDPKAELLTLDSTLAVSVLNTGAGAQTLFNNLPAIRFLADGTVDENSPRTLKLMDSDGFSRVLTETQLRTGYEVTTSQR